MYTFTPPIHTRTQKKKISMMERLSFVQRKLMQETNQNASFAYQWRWDEILAPHRLCKSEISYGPFHMSGGMFVCICVSTDACVF